MSPSQTAGAAAYPGPMGRKATPDFKRGRIEASTHVPMLRERWPKAFPRLAADVRPLAGSVVIDLAAALGWSAPYARAVAGVWKRRTSYCQAILQHRTRIGLDGAASAETVDDGARQDARQQLDILAGARRKRKQGAKAAPQRPAPIASISADP